MTPASQQRFSNFSDVAQLCARFSVKDFNDKKRVEEYSEAFGIRELCKQVEQDRIKERNSALLRSVSADEEKPFGPNYDDLCRLHWLCLTRKTINVLEFGSGYSTVILADAAKILHHFFAEWASENIRAESFLHIFSVEEEQRFMDITQQRLGASHSAFATLSRSSVELTLIDNRIATVYTKLPNISPDFIYLDGPSQFATTQELNGFSLASPARMPMSADIVRFEFFLEPGTLILVDGRTANARFLKATLKRNWAYEHDPMGDIHFFELQEPPLGRFNAKKLKFCLEGKWLLK